jgi:hypothetical protein
MLIAAMILGLIGGITYFVGGCTGIVSWPDTISETAPWWMIMVTAIGAAGAMGAAMARTKPSTAGIVMLLAAAVALGVGIASYNAFAGYVTDGVVSGDIPLPVHPFAGSIWYTPVPLLTLIIGGVLALSSGKRTGAED